MCGDTYFDTYEGLRVAVSLFPRNVLYVVESISAKMSYMLRYSEVKHFRFLLIRIFSSFRVDDSTEIFGFSHTEATFLGVT